MFITESDLDQMVKVAEEIEKGKDCLSCGRSFIPLDNKDFFCKSCLRKLYLELLENLEEKIGDINSEFPWRIKDIQEVIKTHNSINKRKELRSKGGEQG